ncbi:MAG: Aldo/keto reductase [Candidatus Angelobacter sp.]|jgi:aryl-alcohol dehydrogenase-like predicted oxidoreductase|nr:Aldo/keto reductase [Candidatus Angelobacter sp.]
MRLEMKARFDQTRRTFLKAAAVIGAASMVPPENIFGQRKTSGQVPKRPLGRTGLQVSIIGVGGYHLGSAKSDKEANEIISKAVDNGINFFDNCWEYHDGLSEERMGKALRGKRDQVVVMTKVCTHGRDRNVAMQMLEESLNRLETDHVDLWQIHEVIYDNDPDLIFARNGAAEALLQAKQQGKTRYIGFTGHKNPSIHLKMLQHDFPFDTVQMPLNCFDANFRSFEQQVLPEVNRRGMAALGMKSLGGSGEMVRHGAITPEQGLRYAMSLPVAVTISGMESVVVLEQNLGVARSFSPMTQAEMQALRDVSRMYAADGRYELFKTTKKYDGKVGRQQHDFPPVEQLPV